VNRRLHLLLCVGFEDHTFETVGLMFGEDGVAAWLDVRAAFGRLSAKERAALISVGLLGFTPDEASEPLGMSPGAVRAAVSRAREKLESER